MTDGVLIFGGTGGIGAALARRLAHAGMRVHLAARDTAKLAQLGAEIGCSWTACDVADDASIAAAVEAASPDGRLAGLAYCVGSIVLKPLRSATREDFRAAFELNTIGAAMAVKAARSALAASGGSVVLFSTVAVDQGFANHSVISAAKGGVDALGRALAAELAPAIRVNVIAPSLTRTPLASALLASDQMAKAVADMHALPRLGEAHDAAALAVFLLGPESGWMTGQTIGVDGGRSTLRTRG